MKAARFRLGVFVVFAFVSVLVGSGATQASPSSAPSLSVTTAPLDPSPGSSLTITAVVTPGTDPTSTGLSVNCDLSWAGLGSSSPLFDDGTNGDANAGDLTFTSQFTIPSATGPGTRIGSCSVSDAEGRGNSASYSVNVVPAGSDLAPTVGSHTPDTGETNVAVDSNIAIVFSEPVDVTAPWYSIECGKSGSHSAIVSGGPTSFLLNPDLDFATSETCAVTVDGTQISDQDASDPPDNVVGNPSWTFTTVPDAAPFVSVRSPASSASDVSVDSSVTVTFSEPVDVTGGWYTISCSGSGTHSATASGGPQTFTLDPDSNFGPGEACIITIVAAHVSDQDTDDPPDKMIADDSWSFTTATAANEPPTASAGGPYTVNEGSSVSLAASGSDPEGGLLTYAWDLDGNGTFETSGQSPTFSAAALDGPGTQTVTVRVTDDAGQTASAFAQITIVNVAPTATFNAPSSSPAGFPFTLSLTSPNDPSGADSAAGFTYAFDCGTGYGSFDSQSSVSCATTDSGTRSVGGKIRDKDGGVTEYNATVQLFVTFASLCDLVRSYSSDPQVADVLCAKLAAAETAPTDTARAGHLDAFRNQVDAKTGTEPGKAFTAAQGAELKLLSTSL
ncbi:MAG TPA: Ig-like domain-containing protein [Gaiellaceae bacterium]